MTVQLTVLLKFTQNTVSNFIKIILSLIILGIKRMKSLHCGQMSSHFYVSEM